MKSGSGDCLHAVASREVSVDEVLAAEVLHAAGNVGHKLHQHLRGEVLSGRAQRQEADVEFLHSRGRHRLSCLWTLADTNSLLLLRGPKFQRSVALIMFVFLNGTLQGLAAYSSSWFQNNTSIIDK